MKWLRIYRWSDLPWLAGLALVYAVLAKIALSFFSANSVVSMVWPASGLALAVLLMGGKKYWPGIFVGSLAGNVMAGSSVGASILIASGSTVEALTCVWLLARVHSFDSDLMEPRDFLWLGFAGVIGSFVSALIGIAALLLTGVLGKQAIAQNLLQWWQGDTLGIILVTPLMLVWCHLPRGWLRRERVVETAACFGLAFLAGQVIFLGWFGEIFGTAARGFWVFLFITWAATRFGRHGALLIIGMTAIQMLTGMVLEVGGAVTNQVPVGLLNFWFYMLALTAVGVVLATILESRKKLELERVSQIRYLDIMERVNRASIIAETVEEMLEGVLEEILKVFDADRAWFLYPCDPEALSWEVPMERTRPEWSGVLALGKTMPINPEIKGLFESLLESGECIQYGPVAALPVPSDVAEQFSIKSQMVIALRPKVGKAWVMGLHHCSKAHFHDENDQAIFKGIAHRVSDSLSSFAALKDRRESEERSLSLFQNAPVGLLHSLPTGKLLTANPALATMLGYASPEKLIADITDMGAQVYVDPQKRVQIIKAALEQDEWVQEEADLRRKDGSIITTNIIMRKVPAFMGTDAYLEGFIQDITERKRSGTALAESERRFRFLSELGDLTRSLTEPEEILANITRLLGSHLQASRCAYADVEADSDHFIVPHDYSDSCASIVGDYRLASFGPRAVSELHAGRILVIDNVDVTLSRDEGRDMFNTIEVKAIICCPLVKQGVLRAMMAVHQTTPRAWTPGEISLVEEVAERCWAIIERARAEKERKLAEELLRTREQEQRQLVEQLEIERSRLVAAQRVAKIGSWETDLATMSVIWSEETHRIHETDPATFVPTHHGFLEFVHPEDRARVDEAFNLSLSQRDACKIEHRLLLPDGRIKFVEERWQVVLDSHEKPIRAVGTCQDITERKQIENELLITQTAIEKSQSAFFRVSPTGQVLYVNDFACQSLGYTREEILNMKVWEFDPNFPPEAWTPMWEGLRKTKVVHIETCHQRKDGTIFPVEVVGNVIFSEGEEYSFVFVQDITKRKQSEERIQRLSHLYKALSETNEAIVRMEQQAELFPLVCRCAVEFGGMKIAWIGQLDKSNGIVTPVASYGDSTGYLDSLRLSSHADSPEGQSTTSRAIRENRAIIVNDFHNNSATAPWHARAEALGWASAAAFPIQRGGQPFAVLTVCHAQVGAFDEEAIALLTEMSVDISFALDNFDRETQRKAAEESLQLAASVYNASSEAIMITNADNQIIAINPAFTKITGYTLEEVMGKNPSIFSSGQHDEAFYEAMWREINTSGYWQGEIWDKRKSGEVYPRWLTINTIFNENGAVQQRVAMFTDITQKRESEELIWRQANFDFLTGLPNRQMFHDRLDQDIKKANRASRPLALMLLDLDRFKEVNDTLGHDMGDLLLKETAKRLSSCVRESDTVARLGGDEFIILLGDLVDPGNVERVAQDILGKLTEPFPLGNEVVYVSASIGITLYPEDTTEIEALLKNADQAMYASKNQGRNRYSYFTPSMQQEVQTRMQIANDLRSALAGNQFWVAYQPIVELATGNIHKAEALIRWQHPTKGLINPAAFIPIAEDTGLIVDIGNWVFRQAAEQVKRWRTLLHPEFQISVNKSPVQFHNEGQSHLAWYDHLKKLELPGQSITVEITEGLLLEASAKVADRLLEFRDAGIQVAIDDFGTGYSALSYLKKFDIDYLKIDQSFTRNLAPGSDDMALCEAMIVMAHKLGMKVIAEGVETEEQKALLVAAGCDYAQGYLFSKPVKAKEFELLLGRKTKR